jgi:hypothetical protein
VGKWNDKILRTVMVDGWCEKSNPAHRIYTAARLLLADCQPRLPFWQLQVYFNQEVELA